MNEIQLQNRLIEIGYKDTPQTDMTIARLLSLKGDSRELLEKWLSDDMPVMFKPIEGVDSSFLREKLSMKEPAIIIAHSMLVDAPIENSEYFKKLASNIIGFYPNQNE